MAVSARAIALTTDHLERWHDADISRGQQAEWKHLTRSPAPDHAYPKEG